MSQPIDMNNNFIENLKTPTANDHATSRGYTDSTYVKRSGGVMLGMLNMTVTNYPESTV